jgi:hypothetical protein
LNNFVLFIDGVGGSIVSHMSRSTYNSHSKKRKKKKKKSGEILTDVLNVRSSSSFYIVTGCFFFFIYLMVICVFIVFCVVFFVMVKKYSSEMSILYQMCEIAGQTINIGLESFQMMVHDIPWGWRNTNTPKGAIRSLSVVCLLFYG